MNFFQYILENTWGFILFMVVVAFGLGYFWVISHPADAWIYPLVFAGWAGLMLFVLIMDYIQYKKLGQ